MYWKVIRGGNKKRVKQNRRGCPASPAKEEKREFLYNNIITIFSIIYEKTAQAIEFCDKIIKNFRKSLLLPKLNGFYVIV